MVILLDEVTLFWNSSKPNSRTWVLYLKYVSYLLVPYIKITSVFGFVLLLNMVAQMWSGFLLSLFYIPDPSFVITFREEYINEIWWFFWIYRLHVTGVDTIFFFSYLHIFKKIYIKNFVEADNDGWSTGTYAFLFYHIVVFFGITLSTTHLGDVTVTIGANIWWSICLKKFKTYCIFFTNQHLNVDLLIRFMVFHYVFAYYYVCLVQIHIMFIHESWDSESQNSAKQDTSTPKPSWFWDVLKKELSDMFNLYVIVMVFFILILYPNSRVIDFYNFEQWSESEFEDVNFYIVGPHWYFRAHMGLLTVCAKHYEGLFWLLSFYLLLGSQPQISKMWSNNQQEDIKGEDGKIRISFFEQIFFFLFFSCIIYVGSVLPCGRFYYDAVEGFFGHVILRLSYEFIFIYLFLAAHLVGKFERWVLLFFSTASELSKDENSVGDKPKVGKGQSKI